MRNRWMFIAAILVFASLILSACQTEPTEAPQVPAYPEPEQAAGETNAYAAPQLSVELVAVNPYPIPEGAEELEWGKIAELLNSGQVAEVLQTSTLKIVITTRDGRTLFSQEPQANEILNLLEACGANCAEIKIKSEF